MDSYNFTYKDVLKRRERMINRVEKWEVHVLAIIMLVVTAFFTLSTFCFADTETIDFSVLEDVYINDSSQIAVSQYSTDIFYANVQKGHTYTVTMHFEFGDSTPSQRTVVYGFSNSTELGSQVNNVNRVSAEYQDVVSITFTATDDILFLVSPRGAYADRAEISNFELVEEVNLQSVSDNLAQNVGINQIWDIFGSGIDFVYVVVIVAFGIFLVAFAIRKISKGKSEF